MSNDLKQRLVTLRRQSGIHPATPGRSDATLADRIRRCRTTVRTPVASTSPADDEHFAAMLGASVAAPGLVMVETRLSLDHEHGSFGLRRLRRPVRGLAEMTCLDPRRAVFVDTETTGLSGGTGTTVFMLGMARVVGPELVLRQYVLSRFAGERAMFAAATDWMSDDDVLLSFNGRSFDLPLLQARARLLGCHDPFAGKSHVDLLHPTRRAFGGLWPDCRLLSAEQRLLGFERINDLPGSEAPASWLAYLQRGDASRLPGVVQHNQWDLVSLAVLLPALADVYTDPAHWQANIAAVARGYAARGHQLRAFDVLQRNRASLDEVGALEFARMLRRRRQWPEACAIWQGLLESGNVEAIEQLAKYHEHVCRNYVQALHYAQRLPQAPDHVRRVRRLVEKISDLNTAPRPALLAP